ncbi:4-alpha-glucanotransferase [soil metagenome]
MSKSAANLIPRSSGILLHPTSLPGPYGIGDLGPVATRWLDTLAAMKQSWWQILPLGPTGFGDSPYQCFSAFAGNVLLLSPELMIEDGLLAKSVAEPPHFPGMTIDYDAVMPYKNKLVRTAWSDFKGGVAKALRPEFEEFQQREALWLQDYCLFMAVRAALGGRSLADWPREVLFREPTAMAALEKDLKSEINYHAFGQFLFDRQWTRLRKYAATKKVQIIGDLPIFVSADSADVWANPDQFLLDNDRRPTVVAGVPPDYFSEDGQHWGNPIYDWSTMKKDGYRWWIARVQQALKQVDLIRLDHFRGFAQAWHIPAAETTARNGKWVDGPGLPLFEAIRKSVGKLPLIAEDLGLITPDVHLLRETLGLPGMRVLQFMLGDAKNPYQPHNYEPNTACYTGTHDNDTSAGWSALLSDHDRETLTKYLGFRPENPAHDLMRTAWASVATMAIAPLQDVFCSGSEARMNVPGKAAGNWGWRFTGDEFSSGLIEWVAEITERYARVPIADASALHR